jgi:hypothetical protein
MTFYLALPFLADLVCQDMTKFSSDEDPGYKKVIGIVRRWHRKWQSSVNNPLEKEEARILQGTGPLR